MGTIPAKTHKVETKTLSVLLSLVRTLSPECPKVRLRAPEATLSRRSKVLVQWPKYGLIWPRAEISGLTELN